MGKKFEYQILIKENHLDTFGHVNNATYLVLFEEARWDFITKFNWGLDRIMKEKIGPVVLQLNLIFKREIINRETITITTEFVALKNPKVFQMHQEMLDSNGIVKLILDIDVGIMDLQQRKLITPSDEWMNMMM